MQIRRVELPTSNQEAQLAFYRDVLELPVSHIGISIAVAVGPSTLVFTPGLTVPQHFAFNVADFDRALAWLQSRVPIHRDASNRSEFAFPSWSARAAYFRDPDGNVLEIIAREHRPLPSEGHPLHEVSEVGVACDDVLGAVGRLGLPVYGDPSDDFAAVGDVQGLLILVRRGRVWYPDTGIEAQPSEGRVVFAGGEVDLHTSLSALDANRS